MLKRVTIGLILVLTANLITACQADPPGTTNPVNLGPLPGAGIGLLQFAFLVLLAITLVFFQSQFGGPGLPWLRQTLSRIMLLAVGSLTAGLFFVLLFGLNPWPAVSKSGEFLGLWQVVDFGTAFENSVTPPGLAANLRVVNVIRENTDADAFNEWVVFYAFDDRGVAANSIYGAIYDNDRGNPPVIFPYQLRAPDRDYLSNNAVFGPRLVVQELDLQGANGNEIIVQDATNLTIFRHVAPAGQLPTDSPARYRPIGFFRGNGGVNINLNAGPNFGDVTVSDQNGFERSQLVLRSVYQLRNDRTGTNSLTYLDPTPPLGTPSNVTMAAFGVPSMDLAAPSIATIDFLNPPPAELLNTPFPEKIVLGFYAATCAPGTNDGSLCNQANLGTTWSGIPRDFLGGAALTQFVLSSNTFFSLPPGIIGNVNIQVAQLCYYPGLETDPDLLPINGGLDVFTGEEGQVGRVEIAFTVGQSSATQTARYAMGLNPQGQWKIMGRLPDLATICSSPQGGAGITSANQPPIAVGVAIPQVPVATPSPSNFSPPAVATPVVAPNGQVVPVIFSAVGSSDPDGDNAKLQYLWTFEDGTTQSGQVVTKDYTSPSNPTAILKVTDEKGATAQITVSTVISLPPQIPPTANPNGPYEGLVCQEIEFSGNGSTDPDGGSIVEYRWDFGDGVRESTQSVNIGHIYQNPGIYTASLVVIDDEGQTSDPPVTTTVTINLPPRPPCGPPPCCG